MTSGVTRGGQKGQLPHGAACRGGKEAQQKYFGTSDYDNDRFYRSTEHKLDLRNQLA